MYPRNAASPPRISVGPVVQISDGAVQTSGVSVVVQPEGGSESAGGGTVAYSAASGCVLYTPTQAETNYTAFIVTAYKTGCIPASVTVVTTAVSTAGKVDVAAVNGSTSNATNLASACSNYSATRGLSGTALPAAAADAAGGLPISDAGGLDLDSRLDAAVSSRLAPTIPGRTLDVSIGGAAGVDWANVESASSTVGLTGTTISTSQQVSSVSGAVGSVTGSVGSVTGSVGSVTGNVGGNVLGSVGSVLGGINTGSGTITTLDALDTAQDSQHAATQSAIPSAASVADAVLDEALSGHVTAGTLGKAIGDGVTAWVTATGFSTLSSADAQAAAAAALTSYDPPTYTELLRLVQAICREDADASVFLTAEYAAINQDFGFGGGFYDANSSQRGIRVRGDVAWLQVPAATIRNAVGLASANLDAQLSAIVTDTNELQGDWTNGGRLDLLLDSAAAGGGDATAASQATIINHLTDIKGGTWSGSTDSLEAIRDALPATGGTGANVVTITVNDGTDPLESVKVRATKGAESYLVETNASGQAVFALDDGTWTVTATLPLYQLAPQSLAVSGATSQTYSLAAVSIPASDPGQVTGYLYCYDASGAVEQGVTVELKVVSTRGHYGIAHDDVARTATSGADGLVSFSGMFPGLSYSITRQGTAKGSTGVQVPAGATSPYELPSIHG